MISIRTLTLVALFLTNVLSAANFIGNNCCDYPSLNFCQEYQWGFWFDPMGVKPGQMPLEFAEEAVQVSTTTSEREDFFFKPDFQFGFRLGAGISPSCGRWSVRADYIYWRNEVSDSVTTVGTGIAGTILQPKIADSFGRQIALPGAGDTGVVDSTLKYWYDLLDITTGWSCCACCGLELTPYGGFRGLWFSTEVIENDFDSTGVTFSAGGATSSAENSYAAYGIVGGLRLNYNFFGCFNFFGSFGGSLIGGFNDNFIQMVANGSVNPQTIVEKEEIYLFIHSLEGSFGVRFDSCLCGYMTSIGVGYEVTQWNEVLPHPFRQNSTSPGNATKTSNGLYIQAITGKLGIQF